MTTTFFNHYEQIAIVVIAAIMIFGTALAQPPGGHLNITEVHVDVESDPARIIIVGTDMDFGPGPLVVTLGSLGAL
ncbi:hypothetical protein D1AOALGA4SA_2351 [Olavius algarvensis Delta 1 endosymbiont]|nr:hypothetical protein D1AOALGA4SA_2351 [Olavius algarvensis Delta 1 endosymbiont]